MASTFAILKPDLVSCPPILQRVLRSLLNSQFQVQRVARLQIQREQAIQLYKEHEGRYYYNRLIRIICSGPSILMELKSKNGDPIPEWRKIIGPSKFLKGFGNDQVDKETFRWQYALSDVRNTAHGADSTLSAQRELAIFNHQLITCTTEILEQWSQMGKPLDTDDTDLIEYKTGYNF